MSSPFDAVSNYFFAKDGNRPHLMRRVFAEDAELVMAVRTDAISFPESATGIGAIEDILARRYTTDFENVYTFGLSRPTAANRRHFPCHWLVGMSAKDNRQVRVGCGRYDWYFAADETCLVEKLKITIDKMQVFPKTDLAAVMNWLSGLPYPWCTPEEAVGAMPNLDGLAVVEQYLNESRPISPD